MKNILCKLGVAGCAGVLFLVAALQASDAGLAFRSAWVRAMPPGMKMTAAFGELRNEGAEAIELVAWASPQYGEVSLHRTELVDGVSRMRTVPSLAMAAGETVSLEPGGYHLMLMMPSGPFGGDQWVTIEMSAADGRVFRFELPVERR